MLKKILVMTFLFSFLITKGQEVKWYSFEEAVQLNKKEPRKLIIDVYTSWCKYCKIMDSNTFSNPVVADYLNKKYYPVKFNAEQTERVIFNKDTFRFVAQGGRGYHELAAALLNNQLSYPSIVFMDETLKSLIYISKGYVDAKTFDGIVKFIGDDSYKTQTWENWIASYKSPFAN
jgi:thioredoxin-related protein